MKSCIEDSVGLEDYLRGKFPYCKEQTSSSVKFTVFDNDVEKNFFFTNATPFFGKHFQLIKQVKGIGSSYKGLTCKPKYFDFNFGIESLKEKEITGYELDLSHAYLSVCARYELLPIPLIRQLRKCRKEFRLRILGALATKKSVTTYTKSGRAIKTTLEFCPKSIRLWHFICGTVDRDLIRASRADAGYVGFWVDNYFTTNWHAAGLLRGLGYRVKIKRVKMQFRFDNGGVKMNIENRPFYFSRKFVKDTKKIDIDKWRENRIIEA